LHNGKLQNLVSHPKGEASSRVPSGLRFIVAGVVWEPPAVMTILDELGISVVGDDLCTGTRYIEEDVSIEGDPIEALVKRHFNKGPFSPIHDRSHRIADNLLTLLRKHRADGILYLHLKFFESQDYDLPDLKGTMKREEVPMYVLDTEYQTTHLAQMKTRVQAFAESLRGGRLW
jgi:benzoyl-CoA reductase subunit C